MNTDELYISRCLQIAENSLGNTYPNPMVGCIIVYDGKIIGEGYHQKCGEAHAEVNAINSVKDKSLLSKSTLYVNLEPCSHYGKTPPCADLIIKHQIKRVVIGTQDVNELVSGNGIKKLQDAKIEVVYGVIENECNELNKRFNTYHLQKRPYIILKWAKTSDGFIDRIRTEKDNGPAQISDKFHRILSHKWRKEENAIMVGTNTALLDNPELTTRHWHGNNPVRIVIDKNLRLPKNLKLFNNEVKTLVFTEQRNIKNHDNLEYIPIDFNNLLKELLKELFERKICSLIVEGGTQLLNLFINNNIWDEARIFTSDFNFNNGIKAPVLKGQLVKSELIDNCLHELYLPIK